MEKFMDLSVNGEVKNYLNRLSREYVFHYMFSGEKYGLVNNLNILKKPLLILGPEDASEKYGEKIRIWAYGGSIATIDTRTGDVVFTKGSKDYIPYLCDGYKNDKKFPEEFHQEGLFDELGMPAEVKYKELLEAHNKKSGGINPDLLNLSVFAAYTRYLNRSVYKTYPSYPQEKSIQCVIAKQSMLESIWREDERNMVVIDVETHLFKKKSEHPRADFVVFDGEAFGLIEFKYLGMSMDRKENNLEKHYKDFVAAMKPENGRKLFEELKMKLKFLMAYGLIDKSWQEKAEAICKRKYDESVLWCGFYFLGDATDIPGKKTDIVRDRIEKQLIPVCKKIPVKCRIARIDPECIDKIQMDTNDIKSYFFEDNTGGSE